MPFEIELRVTGSRDAPVVGDTAPTGPRAAVRQTLPARA
ncbi:hypothetical protein R2601_00625 [Salipiger bermudensis HTCC2601]|uniref:Uncharacterized protein n=1 Tax=Salipiger bermudensis (strain DSM 26914 / JCM 13377 / KCTC 12554 / HTCC2601) TaxID=314265 RepID=Q0FV33_SALBH|nr:hypothetical protein R2601_00625 [Salipiger bermudensis HTCC2601]